MGPIFSMTAQLPDQDGSDYDQSYIGVARGTSSALSALQSIFLRKR
jgi:hypothetical protein